MSTEQGLALALALSLCFGWPFMFWFGTRIERERRTPAKGSSEPEV